MELINETGIPARLSTGALDDRQNAAWCVARATWRIAADGRLDALDDAPWPILDAPLSTAYGGFPSDAHVEERGCGLVVTGEARFARAVTEGAVRVRAGDFSRALALVGDRAWTRVGRDWEPSAPRPFRAMRTDWSRAYGGVTRDCAHPFNPEGRGFVTDEDLVAGCALPNLEDPEDPIRRWDQRVRPAGFGPVPDAGDRCVEAWCASQRAAGRAVSLAGVARVREGAWRGAAAPENVVPSVRAGAPIAVALGEQVWAGEAPRDEFVLEVRRDAQRSELALAMTGLWLFLDEGLCVATWRAAFRYPLVGGELRAATLRRRGAGGRSWA